MTHFSGDVVINYEAFSSELFGSSVSDGVAGTFTITVDPVADTPSFLIGTPPSGLKNETLSILDQGEESIFRTGFPRYRWQ